MCGLSNMLDRPLRNGSYINYCEHNAKLTTGQLVKKYTAPPLTETECSLPRSLPDPIPTSINPVKDLKTTFMIQFKAILFEAAFSLTVSGKKKKSPVRVKCPTHLGRFYFITLNRTRNCWWVGLLFTKLLTVQVSQVSCYFLSNFRHFIWHFVVKYPEEQPNNFIEYDIFVGIIPASTISHLNKMTTTGKYHFIFK